MTVSGAASSDRGTELIGPYGPERGLDPRLWTPMDCDRCHQPITLDDQWFMEVPTGPPSEDDDGPAFHGGCLVG